MYESVAHRFADLSETGFGVALLNDAKYGHSVRDNVLGLSLVRGPIYPDPLADEGAQSFTYALMPHAGQWHDGGVREEAEDLNQPLLSMVASGLAPGQTTLLDIKGTQVALSVIKRAEDCDDLIVRVYEPAGGRGPLVMSPRPGWAIGEALTLMEEKDPARTEFDILPFEVRSFRLAKG